MYINPDCSLEKLRGKRELDKSNKNSHLFVKNKWLFKWRRRDSNPQPLPCKGSALPIELRPRWELFSSDKLENLLYVSIRMGVGGLEPPTSALSELRSNQLSYTPSESKGSLIVAVTTKYSSQIISIEHFATRSDSH